MKLISFNLISRFVIFTIILMTTSCASLQNPALNSPEAPIAENYASSYQKQLQASKHWAIIADDLANQVKANITEKKLVNRPVFINLHSDQTDFTRAFNDFLITSLVNKGVSVSKQKIGSTIYNYKIQTIEYKSSRSTQLPSQVKWTTLAAGLIVFRSLDHVISSGGTILGAGVLADVWNSDIAPKYELIITSSILSGHVYIARTTDIYYANNTDSHLYETKEDIRKNNVFDDPFYQTN